MGGYYADMNRIGLDGDYAKSFCGGNVSGCAVRENFPGDGTTSIMGWDNVWETGSQLPEKEWSGEWWRGNELGYIINNPVFWTANGVSPSSIALGITPSQHVAIRPTLEKIFRKGFMETRVLRRTISKFLSTRQTIHVSKDIAILVHQILYKHVFKRKIAWERAEEFVALQGKVVALASFSQPVPDALSEVFFGSTANAVGEWIKEHISLLESLYGQELQGQSCTPSPNCTVQLASAVWDALYAAGGLSVPGTISTGLAVLYSRSSTNPFTQMTYKKNDALSFYWETIRYFPPVLGFPHWETRPTCAGSTAEATAMLNKSDGKTEACPPEPKDFFSGYPKVKQYSGGKRVVPNLGLAMRDPAKWGEDADQFVIRHLDEYKTKSVGFAEMAVNKEIAEGRMDRVCPGKQLALEIGKTFFELFDQGSWEAPFADWIFIRGVAPFVVPFFLQKRSATKSATTVLESRRLSEPMLNTDIDIMI